MNDLNSYIWLQKIFDNINFDNLPHGIIINGPRGIGKIILANAISSQLLLNKKTLTLDIELFNSNNHPDYFVLNKEKILLRHITYRKAKKRDEWDEELGERNVNEFLSTTPSVAINKVALILNAHTMDKEPQNALLKSLEEPSPNTFIIITSDRPKALYQTIYSRCQVITIPSLTNSEIDEWLASKGISDFKATDFPSYASPLNIMVNASDLSNVSVSKLYCPFPTTNNLLFIFHASADAFSSIVLAVPIAIVLNPSAYALFPMARLALAILSLNNPSAIE